MSQTPTMESNESKRLRRSALIAAIASFLIGLITGLAVLLMTIAAIFMSYGMFEISVLFIMSLVTGFTIGFGLAAKVYRPRRRKYANHVNAHVIPDVLSDIFTDIRFDANSFLDEKWILQANLIHGANKFSGDSLLRAKYKTFTFIQSNLHIEESSRMPMKIEVTRFLGKWIIVDFNKNFDGYVRAFGRPPPGKNNPFLKVFEPQGGNKLQKVQFESEEFNKNFDIKSDSPHTAFYIFTPQFIERVQAFQRSIKGQLLFAFVNGQLHIAINSKHYDFAPSILRPAGEDHVKKILQQVKVVCDLID